MSARELRWRIGGQDVVCRIEESRGQGTFYVLESALPFRMLGPTQIEISGKRHRFYVLHNRNSSVVWLDGRTYFLERAQQTRDSQSVSHHAGEIRALMPGKLLRLAVKVGDTVAEKQTLATMESMKMESPLVAHHSGRVSEIRFKPGDAIDMGEVVVVIET